MASLLDRPPAVSAACIALSVLPPSPRSALDATSSPHWPLLHARVRGPVLLELSGPLLGCLSTVIIFELLGVVQVWGTKVMVS